MKLIDPSELKPHPDVKALPRWDDEDPRFLAFCDDVRDHGIRVDLLITEDNQIVDGVIRWRAAKRRQLKEVPCKVISAQEADNISLTAIHIIAHRKHYTKGALAYVVYPLVQQASGRAKPRGSRYFDKASRPLLDGQVLTAEDVAASIGVGRSTLFQAKEAHEIFAEHADIREDFEQKIIEGQIGLGAALAGINYLLKGRRAGGGDKPPDRQLELFEEGLNTVVTRLHLWEKFDLENKEKAVKTIRKTVSSMPADLRQEWKRAIAIAERQEQTEKAIA